MNPKWLKVKNLVSDPTVAEIFIIDYIGNWDTDRWNRYIPEEAAGVTARAFIDQLNALPDSVRTIHVHINSPGGDIFAGLNIANALREQTRAKNRDVITFVDGLAGSIASVIAMAGREVRMSDNALMMIHEPWGCGCGTSTDLRNLADAFDTQRDVIVATYQWHSPLPSEEIATLMAANTWLTADEAIAKGFATHKVEGIAMAACLEPQSLAPLNIPDQFKAQMALFTKPAPPPVAEPPAPTPTPIPTAANAVDVVRICREGGCPELAEALLTENLALDQVTDRVNTAKAQRLAAENRATEIRTVCKTANCAELAESYITGGMSLDAVRTQLATITAKLDEKVQINNALKPAGGEKPTGIDVLGGYAALNTAAK